MPPGRVGNSCKAGGRGALEEAFTVGGSGRGRKAGGSIRQIGAGEVLG
jgi:hypothetical protein